MRCFLARPSVCGTVVSLSEFEPKAIVVRWDCAANLLPGAAGRRACSIWLVCVLVSAVGLWGCRIRVLDRSIPSDENASPPDEPTAGDEWGPDTHPFPYRPPSLVPQLGPKDAGSAEERVEEAPLARVRRGRQAHAHPDAGIGQPSNPVVARVRTHAPSLSVTGATAPSRDGLSSTVRQNASTRGNSSRNATTSGEVSASQQPNSGARP